MDKDSQATRGGESSQPYSRSPTWKVIWNLQTPNAVKMFLWKACNNILPTIKTYFTRELSRTSYARYVKALQKQQLTFYGTVH